MREKYDFDQYINRKNTNSIKYDFGIERKGRSDLLPLWVADMDFQAPKEVIDDLIKRVQHGIWGYTDPKQEYYEALSKWFLEHFGWEIRQEWNTITPGVVYAICVAIRAFSKEGDGVLIQQPVYYPFAEAIVSNNRKLVNNQLVYEDGKYRIDFSDFEQKIVDNNVKIFILCSPHNPVGRVWKREELERLGKICLDHNVLVIADEIHCDFCYEGYHHIPFAKISEEFAQNAIICTSPSKTFNIAGLQTANILIPNERIRRRYRQEHSAGGYSQGNAFGIFACQSAYAKGDKWHRELKIYLKENLNFLREFIKKRIPQIKLVEPEGTYLVWLDCSGLKIDHKELEKLIVDEAKLWLDPGIIFGAETALFERINIACPRSTLEQALRQLEDAVNNLEAGRND